MTKLELLARKAWKRWGGYAKWTICSGCGEPSHCRSKDGQRFICVDCYDQGHK